MDEMEESLVVMLLAVSRFQRRPRAIPIDGPSAVKEYLLPALRPRKATGQSLAVG